METVLRRVLWTVVTGLWPAMAGAGAEFRAHWTAHLWLPCAAVEALCAVALRARQSRARERAAERERADARERLAELEEQVSAYGDALAVMSGYGFGNLPVARQAGGGTGASPRPGPSRGLRLVPRQGRLGAPPVTASPPAGTSRRCQRCVCSSLAVSTNERTVGWPSGAGSPTARKQRYTQLRTADASAKAAKRAAFRVATLR